MRKVFGVSKVILLATLFGGCYHTNEFLYHDATLQMHEYEMVAKLHNKKGRKIKKISNDTLKMTDNIYLPEEPKAIEDKIVSINITEETPIADVIMELARSSGTDVQLDPTLSGGVNLSLKDKPLRYVFNRICGLTDTRYREKYGIVVFEKDTPYIKSYSLDFLDMTRNSSSSMSLNTSGLTSGSSEVENKVSGTGTSSVDTSSSDTFWDDVTADVKQIIESTESMHQKYTEAAEKIQSASVNDQEQFGNEGETGSAQTTYNSGSSSSSSSTEQIRLNKRAGIITINASEKSHRAIEKYFDKLKKKASAQVLIEMRFMEISLNKKYESGIDWSNLNFGNFSGKLAMAGSDTNTAISTVSGNAYGVLSYAKDINAVAHLFEQFGSTRTLSNPRINATNNQPALMSFATNNVYFKMTAENNTLATTAGSTTVTNINAEAQTMPVGVIMSVLPSIDAEKGLITLNLRPTISKIEDQVTDPTTITVLGNDEKAQTKQVDNKIPVANVRELDTILKLKDGQTAIIGGFTERRHEAQNTGIPFFRALPIIGNLFSYKSSKTVTTETVILVKATIVNYGAKMSEYEEDVYNSFSDDPRLNEIY